MPPQQISSPTADRRARRTARDRVRRALLAEPERGEVTVELVIATPLLLLALLAIIQFALWSHATHVAQAAASQALATARTQNGTSSAGHAAGRRLLDDLAAGPLRNARLTVSRDATTVSVTIRGDAAEVLPSVHLPVRAEAAGQIERFISDPAASSLPAP